MDDTFLKMGEAIIALDCSYSHLRRMVQDGRVKGVKVGKQVKIPASEIARLIAERQNKRARILNMFKLNVK